MASIDAYGQVLNQYATTRRITGSEPEQPWAIYLAGADGRFTLVCLDHDAKNADTAAAAERDAAISAGILSRAGLHPVVCASGPTGGRHVWVALADSIDAETVGTLARLLHHICPTLDVAPLSNPATGCVRPPGAPHRAGGHSTVLTGHLEDLTSPTGTAAQLEAALAHIAQLVEDAAPTDVPAAHRPLPMDAHGHLYLPGPRRALPSRSAAAVDEDAASGDASAVLWRVLIGAAAARWRFEDVATLIDRPGLAHARSLRDRSTRRPRSSSDTRATLARQWHKAVQHVAATPRRATTDDPTFDPRAKAIATTVLHVQERADAAGGRWTTPAGPADRRVLDTLCLMALQGLTDTVEADIRRTGLLAGIGRETARTALLRLSDDGWIAQVATAEGPRAAHWTITPPSAIHSNATKGRSQADPRAAHVTPTGAAERTTLMTTLTTRLQDAAHDAFTPGALGHHAGNLYARTTTESHDPQTLATLTGCSLPRTRRCLDNLVAAGVLVRDKNGWRRPRHDLRDVAAAHCAATGRLARRDALYRLERALWTWWCAEQAWMRAPRRTPANRRPGHGQLTLIPSSETNTFGAHPRGAGGRADYRAARTLLTDSTRQGAAATPRTLRERPVAA